MWLAHQIDALEELLCEHFNERDQPPWLNKSGTASLARKCMESGFKTRRCDQPGCNAGLHESGEWCTACSGTGWKSLRVGKINGQTRTCPQCKGCGDALPREREARLALFAAIPPSPVSRINGVAKCARCDGRGYVSDFDALPKPQQMTGTPQSEAREVKDKNLAVSVCLERLRLNDLQAEQHLHWLYGNAGSWMKRHHLGERFGREIVLWQFTAYGKRLMGREPRMFEALTAAAERNDDITVALADNAQAHAQALKMAALAKLWTADQQTGGNLVERVSRAA